MCRLMHARIHEHRSVRSSIHPSSTTRGSPETRNQIQRTKTKRKERDGPHANAEIVRGAHTSHRTSLVLVVPRESFLGVGGQEQKSGVCWWSNYVPWLAKERSRTERNGTKPNETKRSEAKRGRPTFMFHFLHVPCSCLCPSLFVG